MQSGGLREDEDCRRVSIKHNLLLHAQTTTRTRRRKEVKQEVRPTGCVVEELEDKVEERARCFHALQHMQLDGDGENSRQHLMPVLLRASKRLRAVEFVVPPAQDDEKYQTRLLYRQAMHVPSIYLTTNEEVPVNLMHYEVSSLPHFAFQVFITNSPVYSIHWEVCPPMEKIESFKTPRLQRVSSSILKPMEQKKAETLKPRWMHTKLTTAYGVHKAVQRVIVTERMQKVKRLKTRKEKIGRCEPVDFIPIGQIHETRTIRAPEKQFLRLCAVDDATEELKKVEEVVVEEEFYDAVDTCQISVASTHTIEAHICYKKTE